MKRRLFKLALFLTIGAVINVAVAWGLAWKLDVTRGHSTVKNLIEAEVGKETPYHLWGVYRLKRPGAMRVFSYHITASTGSSDGRDPGSLLPSWNQDYFLEIHRDELNKFARMQDGRGWPMLALWGQAVADSKQSSQPFCEVEYAILLTDFIDRTLFSFGPSPFLSLYREVSTLWQVRFLPLRPIWLGFAINTIFYASLLWCVTLGPFTARRIIRRKRGRCIKCGYDLRVTSDGGCPECGWGRGETSEQRGHDA